MQWTQIYDLFGHWWLSTLVAALPIIVLLGLLAGFKVKPHLCAIAGALSYPVRSGGRLLTARIAELEAK